MKRSYAVSFLVLLSMANELFSTDARAPTTAAVSGCPKKCGNVRIKYPFGIGNKCFFPGFEVVCYGSVAYIAHSNLQLLEIMNGQMRINSSSLVATSCPLLQGSLEIQQPLRLPEVIPYSFSVISNMYMPLWVLNEGIYIDNDMLYAVYLSRCLDWYEVVLGGNISTNDTAPCPLMVDGYSRLLSVAIGGSYPTSLMSFFGYKCTYGYIIEDSANHTAILEEIYATNKTVSASMKLEWVMGSTNCERSVSYYGYACGGNTTCSDTSRQHGYLCKCLDGYAGNPYLRGSLGCQDIDECSDDSGNNTCVEEAECQNENPGFRCNCPRWSIGDGKEGGTGCIKIITVSKLILAFIACSVSLTLCFSSLFWIWKQRNLVRLRAGFFRTNGGILLQKQLSSLCGDNKRIRIFSAHELEMATDNYSVSRILGSGGNGTVYKGILNNGLVVAIKKARILAKSQIDQFKNEILILSKINHNNVVKLLGCCLETPVPLLVYEFISKGSLSLMIHCSHSSPEWLPWDVRLQIAIETAEALAYLYSSIPMSIIHRDVKSSNILLDDDYTAKVADFGLSRLVPIERTKTSTMVHGTFGYLDPEYYSFGVVLLELLTGRKPVWPDPSAEYCNLAMFFLSHIGGDIIRILDERLVKAANFEELIGVAYIARRCLKVKGEERPAMRKVARELSALRMRSVPH